MALEYSLRENASGLLSERVSERKKSAENLKNFLAGEATPSLLRENTLKKSGYSWNHLFDDVQEYILKECEKFESSKNFENTIRPLATTLLHSTLAGSSKGKAYIKCDKITNAFLLILNSQRLTKAFGDAYLNLLYKYFVTCDYYLGFISPQTWQELLLACISALWGQSNLDYYTRLRLVWLIMKNAIKYCQFTCSLRDVLPKLKNQLLVPTNDKKVQEVMKQIFILLVETLSVEYRLTMCAFTESMMSTILQYYDQNAENRRKNSMFQLLNLVVLLHHPQGRLKNELGSLAHDWKIWTKQLFNILEVVYVEVNYLKNNYDAKYRLKNDSSHKFSCEFFELAASVYYQIFNLTLVEEDCENSAKRQRLSYNKNKVFSDLIDELRTNSMPWVGVIYSYVSAHGDTISKDEYKILLVVLDHYISKDNSSLCWETFHNLVCSILKRFKQYEDCCGEILVTLWNSCVRHSTQNNAAHKSIHRILEHLSDFQVIQYSNIIPLKKLYCDKAMILTDHSVKTLSFMLHKYFQKFNNTDDIEQFTMWLFYGDIGNIDITYMQDVVLRLASSENIDLPRINSEFRTNDDLHNILFGTIDKCILFNEFELMLPSVTKPTTKEFKKINTNTVVEDKIRTILVEKASEQLLTLQNNNKNLSNSAKLIHIILAYCNIIFVYTNNNNDDLKNSELVALLKKLIRVNFTLLTEMLNECSDRHNNYIVTTLETFKAIFMTKYDSFFNQLVRSCVNAEFFHCVHKIVRQGKMIGDDEDENVSFDGDNEETTEQLGNIRHSSILLLSAYCMLKADYRTEILEFILDPTLYEYTRSGDIKCAIECMEILTNSGSNDIPLDPVFVLVQNMCKELFRNPKSTYSLLKVVSPILDKVWAHPSTTIKDNCSIMINSYMQRADNQFYPQYVAGLIYQCAVKLDELNGGNQSKHNFKQLIISGAKKDVYTLRVYCNYLLSSLTDVNFLEEHMENLFLVNITDKSDTMIKDELSNRTMTVLHSSYSIIKQNNYLVVPVINELLKICKKKSLDLDKVKRVLDKITTSTFGQNIEVYLHENILSILYDWFQVKYTLEDLPILLFGYSRLDVFLEKNLKMVLPAEILWSDEGNIETSIVLKAFENKPKDKLIETCFPQLISLCLPFIVAEKYNINIDMKPSTLRQTTKTAHKVFQQSRVILGIDKWNELFIDKMSTIVLMTAANVADTKEVKNVLKLTLLKRNEGFLHQREIFTAVLRYIGELIEKDTMVHLCETQPSAVTNILLNLWEKMLKKPVFEYKAYALHAFFAFVESIPLGYSTDSYVCNFTCNSLLTLINGQKNEFRIGVEVLKKLLNKFIPERVEMMHEVLPRITCSISAKKQEYPTECSPILNYLKQNIASVDQCDAVLQNEYKLCNNKAEFKDVLKFYLKQLVNPSLDTLKEFGQFLEGNHKFLTCLKQELKVMHFFSETCKTSILHQLTNSINNIMTTTNNEKLVVEAANILSKIGTYYYKTLMITAPPDSSNIVDIKPNQYFSIKIIKHLAELLFDSRPNIVRQVLITLARLLRYREGKIALDLGQVDQQLLKPFSSPKSGQAYAKFVINDNKFNEYGQINYWIPKDNEKYDDWIKKMCVSLLEMMVNSENYLEPLSTVCISEPKICKAILPALVGLILHYSNESQINVLSKQINQLLNHVWDKTVTTDLNSSSENTNDDKGLANIDHDLKMIIHTLLEVVDFVRLQIKHYTKRGDDTLETHNYLKLDYDRVAWSAIVSDNSLSALFYGELWAAAKNDNVPPTSPQKTAEMIGGECIQTIFRRCFACIGDMDAIEGCGSDHLTKDDEKRKHLVATGKYSDALLLHDIALSDGNVQVNSLQLHHGVISLLHKSGMHHLALQYIKSLPENVALDDVKYDCLAFLGDWSVIVDNHEMEKKTRDPQANLNSLLKSLRYSCLKDCVTSPLNPQDFDTKMILIDRAKLIVSKLCHKLNMDNCQSVYKIVSQLQLFSDIEDYLSVRCDKMDMSRLLDGWSCEQVPPFRDFKHVEPLITQRSVILEKAAKRHENYMPQMLNLQLKYAEMALSNDRIETAQRLLHMCRERREQTALVEANLAWKKGQGDIALTMLKTVITGDHDREQTATALRQYGTWVAELKRENARDIINKYLKKSLETLGENGEQNIKLKVYHNIAKFADAEYKQVVEYMKSSIFENKVKCMENMKGTASSLRNTSTQQTLTRDERKALMTNEKLSNLDEADIKNTIAEKKRFLELAMRYYLLSLQYGEQYNLSMFRVISLWLENPATEMDCGEETFEMLLHAVPSRKYVDVLPQLTPRLGDQDEAIATNLVNIIRRCAIDHPHHTLPILFSVKNSDKDLCILNAGVSSSGRQSRGSRPEPRVEAAENLVKELHNYQNMKPILAQMEKMCDAIISLANFKTEAKPSRQSVPKSEPICKLKNLDTIPIPTITIPIKHDLDYTNVPTVMSFATSFDLVGGINCPKKMTCRGSDGKERTLLIKGEDDLRQDAVMQQVFNIVNTLLDLNPVTNKNNLSIRTYKVVPLSRRSGVLEWCEGTVPLGTYLVGSDGNVGAHQRYRPKDISCRAARSKLTACHERGRTNADKLTIFLRILREFRPVFHHFFTEHYQDPVTWYERRLAYTKSVATSSMVGYIMGLGDRHVQNILIDKNTAEVIHIDFGIAFDQGRALPTPETVPFRLTQDIVAGFGCSGVEGTFRSCCEKTMQLLRDNQAALLTILEVLLCDPLYSWCVSPAQANRKQDINTTTSLHSNLPAQDASSGLASRALLAAHSKLCGDEGGLGGAVAVRGVVARLLTAASDPSNLARLYPGWQPYL